MADDPQAGTPEAPWFTQQSNGSPSGLSTTTDRGLTNQQVTGVANDLSGQNDDVVAALNAIAAAFTAL